MSAGGMRAGAPPERTHPCAPPTSRPSAHSTRPTHPHSHAGDCQIKNLTYLWYTTGGGTSYYGCVAATLENKMNVESGASGPCSTWCA